MPTKFQELTIDIITLICPLMHVTSHHIPTPPPTLKDVAQCNKYWDLNHPNFQTQVKEMKVDENAYFGVYPSNLFECFNGKNSMHFILSLKHTSPDEIQELSKILQYCGADVSDDLKAVSDYTAVIVDHNDKVDFVGPVFTLNYIKDCLELRKLQDISNYRQTVSKDIPITTSCMSVIYFRLNSWGRVISSSSNYDKQIEVSSEDKSIETNAKTNVAEPTRGTDLSTKSKYFAGEKDRKAKQNADPTTNRIRKNSRLPYSYEEECNILKYIVHHSEYSTLKGNNLWIVMERRKICPIRTWQSMKERFLKKIYPNLNKFPFLTEEEKKQFK